MKKLIKNVGIYRDHKITESQNIAIKDDLIIGFPLDPVPAAYDEVIDGNNMLAFPGFVNTHNHIAMTVFRSYADDMQLMDWLEKKIWPAEDKLDSDIVYAQAMLGIAEMIRCGTTSFADMYFFMDDVARAVENSGIRAALCRGMTGITPNAQQALQESKTFYQTWNGKADGRITIMLGPHAPYTCPPDYLRQVVDVAHELGAEIHTHLCETKGEIENIQKQYGKTPIALMDELGVLDCGCLAAHCVWVNDEDLDILAQKHVRVAHNPGSNLKLASGIAPIPKMLEKGITVGLGTDGASSNNNLDIVEEMHLAAFIHKAHTLDPLVIPAETAINLLTEGGAKCLGYTHAGKLEAGCKADITLLDRNGLHWYPKNDMMSLMTYASNSFDVDTVIVNGNVLLRHKEFTTIDIEKVKAEAERTKNKLFASII
ncbi:N-ethylammeline chlorohydrolase [Megasphaera cerevisiae DSM 20462]|uniref:5-methylthioadenosine/S-adenosylhomocysteine deaminase n=1 Tax=Megasphaera cerevisiae DSM 20462 TaxID=1122219 RepID=A0A0J6X070_9FIRM|nr:amidohydrolase [Megasphaera cerevisiae]KMO87923.1 N-ethylammeline chlorohydrolase [Megasphaera cerevisiae DSM 20462]SJZ43646.1 5-methylthioadenosine/S-adenosylhomocysteine deaminase [Megasphaera cerevisiae DSM 20462]